MNTNSEPRSTVCLPPLIGSIRSHFHWLTTPKYLTAAIVPVNYSDRSNAVLSGQVHTQPRMYFRFCKQKCQQRQQRLSLRQRPNSVGLTFVGPSFTYLKLQRAAQSIWKCFVPRATTCSHCQWQNFSLYTFGFSVPLG